MVYRVIPKFVDTIVVNKTQINEKIAKRCGIPLNEFGQIELTMEFHDGIAYDVEGRVVLTYPRVNSLSKKRNHNELLEKVSIFCDEVNQYDSALAFGTLWYGKEFKKQ